MTAYYSENDPKAAAWLRELMDADVIVRGEVDERDIRDVTPGDLAGFTQCHFFAGIGGWSYALRLASWPDTQAVWTGSCPCQPFSSAGRGAGIADERHLWPVFFRLIEFLRPTTVIGEQVGSPAGMQWLAAVQADLEGARYAFGAADLPAASVGAPHIRQRLFWVAQSDRERQPRVRLRLQPGPARFDHSEVGGSGEVSPVGDAGSAGLPQRVGNGCVQRQALDTLAGQTPVGPGDLIHVDLPASIGFPRLGGQPTHVQSVQTDPTGGVAHPDGGFGGQGSPQSRWRDHRGHEEPGPGSGSGELLGELAYADRGECDRWPSSPGRNVAYRTGSGWSQGDGGLAADREVSELGDAGCDGVGQLARELSGDESQHEERPEERDHTSVAAGAAGFWSDCIWIPCRDGKARPAKPGIFPLSARLSAGVGRVRDPGSPLDANDTPEARTMRLRGYGNSIVPQVAAEFILAYLDISDG